MSQTTQLLIIIGLGFVLGYITRCSTHTCDTEVIKRDTTYTDTNYVWLPSIQVNPEVTKYDTVTIKDYEKEYDTVIQEIDCHELDIIRSYTQEHEDSNLSITHNIITRGQLMEFDFQYETRMATREKIIREQVASNHLYGGVSYLFENETPGLVIGIKHRSGFGMRYGYYLSGEKEASVTYNFTTW